jgi:hypothetical protein
MRKIINLRQTCLPLVRHLPRLRLQQVQNSDKQPVHQHQKALEIEGFCYLDLNRDQTYSPILLQFPFILVAARKVAKNSLKYV